MIFVNIGLIVNCIYNMNKLDWSHTGTQIDRILKTIHVTTRELQNTGKITRIPQPVVLTRKCLIRNPEEPSRNEKFPQKDRVSSSWNYCFLLHISHHMQLYTYLSEINLICARQFGFRPIYSIELATFRLILVQTNR